ncbi:MAG: aminotransferase class V-fold PLP-dependent enzyme [Planctomycetes bacterium]|nr:aminotransferase class V-fold PLP-dependent enzyme [Planctomycetota bacterium]
MTKAYFDNNATTEVDPRILSRIHELYQSGPMNPGSPHSFGRKARQVVEDAKARIREALGLKRHRVLFLASATEALNLAINAFEGQQIVASSIEHPALEEALLARSCSKRVGLIDRTQFDWKGLEKHLPQCQLAAFIWANNETGLVLPMERIAESCRVTDTKILVDASQAPGKLEGFFEEVSALQPDAIVLSGHKMHAPVGIAALVLNEDFPIRPLLFGGSQQASLRPGTEPVVLADALALALELSQESATYDQMRSWKHQIWSAIGQVVPQATKTILDESQCLANTLHFRIPGLSAERQIIAFDLEGIALSSSSACESGASEPSRVLRAMGYDEVASSEGIRISLSRLTKPEEISIAINAIPRVYSTLAPKN